MNRTSTACLLFSASILLVGCFHQEEPRMDNIQSVPVVLGDDTAFLNQEQNYRWYLDTAVWQRGSNEKGIYRFKRYWRVTDSAKSSINLIFM